jgi:hypothetical protein
MMIAKFFIHTANEKKEIFSFIFISIVVGDVVGVEGDE